MTQLVSAQIISQDVSSTPWHLGLTGRLSWTMIGSMTRKMNAKARRSN